MLSRLTLTCQFKQQGCEVIVGLDALFSHQEECDFNPKKLVECAEGCGAIIPKDEIVAHSCVRELASIVKMQTAQIEQLVQNNNEYKAKIESLENDVTILKEFIRSLKRTSIPRLEIMQQCIERNEITSWAESLNFAKVSRWGGIISTPDVVLQTVIKRALIDTSCPLSIADELMENAHERRWPVGLWTLETRQIHRHRYEDYVVRRIRGKQAILIMHFENRHMGDDLITQPGIVIIFAHGIEDAD